MDKNPLILELNSIENCIHQWIISTMRVKENPLFLKFLEVNKKHSPVFPVYKGVYYGETAIDHIEEEFGVELNAQLPNERFAEIMQQSLFPHSVTSGTYNIEVARWFARSGGDYIGMVLKLDDAEYLDLVDYVKKNNVFLPENIWRNLKSEQEVIVLNPKYEIVEINDWRKGCQRSIRM